MEIYNLTATFCHYPRYRDGSGFVSILSDPVPADFDQLFSAHQSDVIFYGHHHPRSDLLGRSRYVNPGAMGCNIAPYARFGILSVMDDGRWDIELRAIPYDPTELFRDFERRQVPARATILRAFFGRQ